MSKYTITNRETGEVAEITDDDLSFVPKDREVAVLDSNNVALDLLSGKTPFHMMKLMEKATALNLSPEDTEYEYGCFVGVPSKDFSEYINTKVRVLGAAIIPHGPYKSKDDPDGPLQPGYLRCLFVIDEVDKQGDNIVLECNGVNVFDHTLNSLNAYGWYMWEAPHEYMIRRGGKYNTYHMKSVQKPVSKRPKPVVVESK